MSALDHNAAHRLLEQLDAAWRKARKRTRWRRHVESLAPNEAQLAHMTPELQAKWVRRLEACLEVERRAWADHAALVEEARTSWTDAA